MPRGGKRLGAGRPKGTGKHGEDTHPMRIPNSLVDEVVDYVESRGYSCPLYSGTVSAGGVQPTSDDMDGMVNLNRMLVDNPKETFFVRVTGDSMLGVGIHDGDMLVVDRGKVAKNGCIVIAIVNGELTVKRLQRSATAVTLLPENDAFEPIHITEEMDFSIWGVVTNVVHQF